MNFMNGERDFLNTRISMEENELERLKAQYCPNETAIAITIKLIDELKGKRDFEVR